MTDHRLLPMKAHDHICAIPGCTRPRHVSKYGREYSRCDEHYREDYQAARKNKRAYNHRPKPAPDRIGEAVAVLVVDWKTEKLYRVTGTIQCEEWMPPTYGDLREIIVRAAEAGVYVAQVQPWKPEDLDPIKDEETDESD